MTPRKKWPHECSWARLDSISLARQGKKALLEVAQMSNNPEILRALITALNCFTQIESKLIAVGETNSAGASNTSGAQTKERTQSND